MKKYACALLAVMLAAALVSCTYPDPYGLAHPPAEKSQGEAGSAGH